MKIKFLVIFKSLPSGFSVSRKKPVLTGLIQIAKDESTFTEEKDEADQINENTTKELQNLSIKT